jgi:hypothetical protein
MKQIILSILILTLSSVTSIAQDWELPMNKGKIQFLFNSEDLNNGNNELCNLYTSYKFQSDLTAKLAQHMQNGKVKFFSATNFRIMPQLHGADMSAANSYKQGMKYINGLCSNGNDTFIGSLNIAMSRLNVFTGAKSGSIKGIYRIILKDNNYEIKIQGFKFTYYSSSIVSGTKQEIVKLESMINKDKITKSDKRFWADFKYIINLFHSTLEEQLASQGSDLDFD